MNNTTKDKQMSKEQIKQLIDLARTYSMMAQVMKSQYYKDKVEFLLLEIKYQLKANGYKGL